MRLHPSSPSWRLSPLPCHHRLTKIVGGLFARWEASRKYLFASMLVLGKTNDSLIEGILILRGQDANPVIQTAPDWESYSVSRLDLSNADDKAYFDAALAWDLVVSGKECADGKVFK